MPSDTMPVGCSATRVTSNDDIIDIPAQDPTSEIQCPSAGSSPNKHGRLCFAPSEQVYNHGSDRVRPLRTMPFDSETWIGNFEDLGSRVWPHPSFKELLARSLTGDSKFPLPDTIAKENRFLSLRLRCCGTSCCPTTQSPFVEYERPSRLETLAFERTQNVIIYPFYVRLSKRTGLQKLFAIVKRQNDGEYRFWKADGTYHESYGLAKGSVSIFQSPESIQSTNKGSLSSSKRRLTSLPTKRGSPAAQVFDDLDDTPLRMIQKKRNLQKMKTQFLNGLDGDPFKDSPDPPSKRRVTADSFLTQARGSSKTKTSYTATLPASTTSKNPRVRGRSRTPAEHTDVQRPTRSLLQINEVCMLAYHLTGKDLKLMYRTNAFTIESGEGSLIHPRTGCAFEIGEQHALYVLSSGQNSLKVVLSKNTTWSVGESNDEMTGGIILLEFGDASARDEFIASIKHLVGMTVGRFGCADDLVIESMYTGLLKQLSERRIAMFEAQKDNDTAVYESTEHIQSVPAVINSEVDGERAVSCPTALTETPSCHAPTVPAASNSATSSSIPMSPKPPQSSLPQVTLANSTESCSSRSQEATDTAQDGPEVLTNETLMKKELLNLLREVYVKYPSAEDDDVVEELALSLKVPLLAGDKERVKELKRDLKVYLIAHHG